MYKFQVRKPEVRRQLERSKHGWGDNIKTYLKKWYMRLWTGFF